MQKKSRIQGVFIFRPLLHLLFVVAMIFIAYLMLHGSIAAQNRYAVASLLVATWSLLLSALIGFHHQAPNKSNTALGGMSGLKYSIKQAIFKVVALLFAVLSIALLYVSIKLLI
ncbi:hypothetical protein SAMN05216262_11644 [Colwellia chukchiensis]|uniref:Uncharacterized protein n=1 Tax=Colwellia chukchiensis TaxID=641665 RepID=A0A1H7RX78_9GAMM|nr:hypothetical protein [Colwellia chukchiensis]SEL64822.1 hypothetical protein SAMN05216262_11644 [Colwellia chukchiensis]